MSEHSLAELAGNRSPLSFVIAIGSAADNVAKTLGVAIPGKAGPQSYAIQRLTQEGRTTIVVCAGDPPGASTAPGHERRGRHQGSEDQLQAELDVTRIAGRAVIQRSGAIIDRGIRGRISKIQN